MVILKYSDNGFVAHLVDVCLNVAVDTRVIVHAVRESQGCPGAGFFSPPQFVVAVIFLNVVPSEAHGNQFIQHRFLVFCWIEKGGGRKVHREVKRGLISVILLFLQDWNTVAG